MKLIKFTLPVIVLLLAFATFSGTTFSAQSQSTTPPTFYNPIMNNGADPSMVFKDGYYYYTQTTGNNVKIWKSETISGIAKAQSKVIYTPPASGAGCCGLWAPELYYSAANNKWYIYFAASDETSDDTHRMYVLESDTSDAFGTYTFRGKIYDTTTDRYAIDGTVLTKTDGTIYFVWSGKKLADNEQSESLFIAPMSDPLTISGPRVLISDPTYSWETSVVPTNEGPEAIYHNGTYSIVYSANASWTDEYGLGILTNTDGNVLNPTSWTKKSTPIFSKTSDVFGPGHGTFTKSPNGSEDWFVYHAERYSGSGWDRNVRAQKFTWNADNTPNLGAPVSGGLSLTVPSGEGLTCLTCNTYYGWGSSVSQSKVIGTWTLNSTTAANQNDFGNGWMQIFRGDANASNFTASADVAWVATGTSAQFPKYGIFTSFLDSNNYSAVFIDKNNNVLATFAVVAGVPQAWQNTNININFTQPHTLKVVKKGTSFSFYLDGSLKQKRTFSLSKGQIGLVTEDTKANYSNVTVN